ncbi:unnamed protein product [Paramecium sonneborni]|uniref:Uncharacterized protein n=1 Tax=Paramecium sonneborni TaxID=65129 RepID=A0A8S1QJN8_9CILI|nr:unnamed protein product [Paramecium sonneborni]
MEQKNNIMDALFMWAYEFNNEDKYDKSKEEIQSENKQLDSFNNFFHIFDFGLSYDLSYIVIFEDKIRKQNNTSRRIKGRQRSDLRIKLLEVKSCRVVFQSSLLCRGFYHINFHFSRDSNFLICQGYWDSYLVIDIQQKKEFIFKNLEESCFIFQMDTISNLYIQRNKKIFHVNLEELNEQQEKDIYIRFNFEIILYFKSFLLKFALISTELFQYIIYLQNYKVIKLRKKFTEIRTQLIIFQNCLMIEQENIHETEYSTRLLHSGKLLRRIKNLFAHSGNIYQDQNGIFKYSFLNIENLNNHSQIKVFDFLRGISKEIFYSNDTQYKNDYLISKFSNQFIFTMILSDLQTQIACYSLK